MLISSSHESLALQYCADVPLEGYPENSTKEAPASIQAVSEQCTLPGEVKRKRPDMNVPDLFQLRHTRMPQALDGSQDD